MSLNLNKISSKDLVEELKTRLAVESYFIEPDQDYELSIGQGGFQTDLETDGVGPATILIITD